MASNEELGEFEWEKHRPSWGEIPVARRDHFAFVHDKKMFIMGGETVGAPPDGVTANNIPYLDLSTFAICTLKVIEAHIPDSFHARPQPTLPRILLASMHSLVCIQPKCPDNVSCSIPIITMMGYLCTMEGSYRNNLFEKAIFILEWRFCNVYAV